MQTTGLFRIHVRQHKVKLNKPFHLMPFGDVHFGAPGHSKSAWETYLEDAKETADPLFLGMGDYMDLASTSERKLLHHKDLHDSTRQTLDAAHRAVCQDFASQIEFMKGDRLLGLIEGNHYYEFQDGTTSTQYLCQLLDTTYLGVSAFVRLQLRVGTVASNIDIWAHHGRGGARLVGGSLNRVQQMAEAAHADIYLMGHDHKRGALPHPILYLNNKGRLREKRQFFCRTGSFLKAYEDNQVSYIADLGLGASDLGALALIITPRRTPEMGFYTDIKAVV